jgi:Uma2 family endonuclease
MTTAINPTTPGADRAVEWTAVDLARVVGAVPLSRIRLDPAPGTATEEDVLRIDAHEDCVCELVDGVLLEKPMAYFESVLASYLISVIRAFVTAKNLGIVTGESGLMRILPRRVRAPDVAFISWERHRARRHPQSGIGGVAPDLAVEVLSAGNTEDEMNRKREEYFRAGVRLVWYVDPAARSIEVMTSPTDRVRLDRTGTLEGGAVLPGFCLPVRDVFAEWDRITSGGA